jgi:hypothetical protein
MNVQCNICNRESNWLYQTTLIETTGSSLASTMQELQMMMFGLFWQHQKHIFINLTIQFSQQFRLCRISRNWLWLQLISVMLVQI